MSQTGRVFFVSRHPGAVEWARQQGVRVDHWVTHLALEEVGAGDTVIGSLPVNLAAEVCARGARYVHLSLNVPAALRGKELTVDDMQACGANLQAYTITEGE